MTRAAKRGQVFVERGERARLEGALSWADGLWMPGLSTTDPQWAALDQALQAIDQAFRDRDSEALQAGLRLFRDAVLEVVRTT